MNKILIVILTLLFISCDKEDDNNPESDSQTTSSIIVTVLKNNKPVEPGTKVFTNPSTSELMTDSFGQVEFENLEFKKYEVYSFVSGVGSGKSIVNLDKEIERVDVNIIEGNFIEPIITILTPLEGEGFSNDESIAFTAQVNVSHTPVGELTFKWSSNIDGELSGGSINPEGLVTLVTNNLTENEHTISLKVTNKLGISGSASVSMSTLYPKMIELDLTVNSNNTNTLTWASNDNDIEHFEVYRYSNIDYNNVLIATLNASETKYIDTEIPFGSEISYYLTAINTLGNSRESTIVSSPGVPIFIFTPNQVEIDPTRPILYLKTGDNNITGINYENMEIEIQSDFPGKIGYFHVGDNGYGNELYVPSEDGWVYIYNLADFSYKESINVGEPVTCVISNNNGLLYTSSRPSPWWEEPLKVFNRNTLSYVDGTGDFDGCRLRILPSNNEIIEITTTIGPVDMDYYKFDSNGNVLIHKDDKYHGDHPLDADIYKVAPFNDFLITAKEGAVYSADSEMNYKGMLPRGSFEFSDFEFNQYGTIIYGGLNSEKRVYLFDSNTLLKIGEKETKGYPFKMFRKGSELIILSSPTPFNQYYGPSSVGVERISL